jgi:8-amino-7-oxononanoate synthase
MATLGKAAGVFGAFVAGESVLIEYLVQNARTSIYTTAMPPSLAAAVMASLNIIRQETQRRMHLQQLIARLREGLRCQHWQLMDSSTAIQPLLIGDNQQTLDVSAYLQEQGILVPAIRPPTVPKDTARLRISLSSAHTLQQVDQLIDAIHAAENEMAS